MRRIAIVGSGQAGLHLGKAVALPTVDREAVGGLAVAVLRGEVLRPEAVRLQGECLTSLPNTATTLRSPLWLATP